MALYLTIALLVFCVAALVAFCLLSKRGEARAIERARLLSKRARLHRVANANPKFFL